jgi:hypothetical protein
MESAGWFPLCVEGHDVFIRVDEGKVSYRTQAEHERLVQLEWQSIEERVMPPEIRDSVRAVATDGRSFEDLPNVLQLLIQNRGASATWVDFEHHPHAAFVHNAPYTAMTKAVPAWTFETFCRPIVYRGPPDTMFRQLRDALRLEDHITYHVLQYGNEALVLLVICTEARKWRSAHVVEDIDLMRDHCRHVRAMAESARGYPASIGAVKADPKPGWFLSTLDTAFCSTGTWRVTMNPDQTKFHIEASAAPRPFVTLADEVHNPVVKLDSRRGNHQ